MLIVVENKSHIMLLRDGDRVATIPKSDIDDFTVINNNTIVFDTFSGNIVHFVLPVDQFDRALTDLIRITDGMGV